MVRPIIGITSASLAAPEGAGGTHPESSVVGRRYVEAVTAAGGVRWPIPLVPDAVLLPSVYNHLDGLILAGGADIRRARYGALDHPAVDRGDPDRDEVELLLVAWATGDGKPLLVPHLERAGGAAVRHDNLPVDGFPRSLLAHEVAVVPGSRVAAALGVPTLSVNSIHHQAVSGPGLGLTVAARAADGVIEAIEDPDLPFRLGAQWHPPPAYASPHLPVSRTQTSALLGASSRSSGAPAASRTDPGEPSPAGQARR